jgi:pyruvate formate lyase activating enzyme
MSLTGFIFNIQRFSIHDGPGIRTTVFLSGCPLRCFWCHNPEGLKLKPQVQFFPQKCILCGECMEICEHAAHNINGNGHIYDRDRCARCGECIEACCAEAVQFTAKEMTVEQVVDEVLRDRAFYETSGGGVTLSGGEPLLQRSFTRAVLERCRAAGVNTAIETSAYCDWNELAELLPLTDLVMMDIKHLDSEKHRAATGVPNERILANAQKLAATGIPIIVRVPVIPTVNDTPEEIAAITSFVASLASTKPMVPTVVASDATPLVELVETNHHISLELLPFHRLAGDKYASLGLDYRARDLPTPTKEHMAALLEIARQHIPSAISR